MFSPPKNIKFRKVHKGRNKGLSYDGNYLSFGTFGLKSITRARLNANQIESARRVISKFVKKEGFLWIRVFPDKPITKKPIEVRMGKGKGDVSHYVFEVKPGKIIYEISGVTENNALKILKLASFKLPFKTIFVKF